MDREIAKGANVSQPPRSEKSIFLDAVEIGTAAERAQFLERACAGHPELRAQVEALLRAQDVSGDLLDAPSVAISESSPVSDEALPASEFVGTVIGPYRLLEQIGEGGMGTVFLAEQTIPVKRQVAVKIIKPGMDSRQVISRFRAEQQALALMDHPHIARVLDAGTTESGRPYFVMELVRGVPITAYCDQHHLSPEERLELFLGVCQAVQHSHQKGVIHRDIKPSNVLVAEYEGKAIPKVIDFGVARATGPRLGGRTLYTEFGSVVGTLEYMSPEQAKSNPVDIDTRSDIYSLGVLLYELLTGTTPLDRRQLKEAALLEVLRIIREVEPPRPSARLTTNDELPSIAANRGLEPGRLSGLVRGDLDWIVMKALDKDRNRRYETANGLGLDIRRYLNHEAVDACPPSAWYRFRKFARRNRVVLASATLASTALITAVVILVISTWLTTRAYDAEREAHHQAEANFDRARKAVDEQLTLVSQSTLFDVPGLQPVRKELLQAALRFYREMATDRVAGSGVLADLALSCLRLSEVEYELSNIDDAVASLGAGLDLAQQLQRLFPDDRLSQAKLAGYWKGNRRTVRSNLPPTDLDAAHALLLRYIELWEVFVRENPGIPGFRSDLANIYNKLGLLQNTRGLNPDAAFFTKKAIDIWEDLHHQDPTVALYRDALVVGYLQLRHCQMDAGEREHLEELSQRALSLSEGLVADFPEVPQYRQDLAAGLMNAGEQFAAAGRGMEAEAAYCRSLALSQDLLTRFPATPAACELLARSSRGLIALSRRKGGFDSRFLMLCQELISIVEKIATDNRDRSDELARAASARADYELTSLLMLAGRKVDAENACRQSAKSYDKLANDFPGVREYLIHRDQSTRTLENILRIRNRTGNPPEQAR